MTKKAVNEFFPAEENVKVVDIEISNGKFIPTYYLMQKLEKEYPDFDFHFVLGTDLIEYLHKWQGGLDFINSVSFIIYYRVGYEL